MNVTTTATDPHGAHPSPGSTVGRVDTDAILRLLQDVAAEVITPRFRSLSSDEVQEKNPGDLVTVAITRPSG